MASSIDNSKIHGDIKEQSLKEQLIDVKKPSVKEVIEKTTPIYQKYLKEHPYSNLHHWVCASTGQAGCCILHAKALKELFLTRFELKCEVLPATEGKSRIHCHVSLYFQCSDGGVMWDAGEGIPQPIAIGHLLVSESQGRQYKLSLSNQGEVTLKITGLQPEDYTFHEESIRMDEVQKSVQDYGKVLVIKWGVGYFTCSLKLSRKKTKIVLKGVPQVWDKLQVQEQEEALAMLVGHEAAHFREMIEEIRFKYGRE